MDLDLYSTFLVTREHSKCFTLYVTHSIGTSGISTFLRNIIYVRMIDHVCIVLSCHRLFFWFISSGLLFWIMSSCTVYTFFFLCVLTLCVVPHVLSLFVLQPCYQKARQWLLANIPSVLVFGVCIGVVQVFGSTIYLSSVKIRLVLIIRHSIIQNKFHAELLYPPLSSDLGSGVLHADVLSDPVC